MQGSGRTVLRISSTDSRPGVAVFDLMLVLAGTGTRTYVR